MALSSDKVERFRDGETVYYRYAPDYRKLDRLPALAPGEDPFADPAREARVGFVLIDPYAYTPEALARVRERAMTAAERQVASTPCGRDINIRLAQKVEPRLGTFDSDSESEYDSEDDDAPPPSARDAAFLKKRRACLSDELSDAVVRYAHRRFHARLPPHYATSGMTSPPAVSSPNGQKHYFSPDEIAVRTDGFLGDVEEWKEGDAVPPNPYAQEAAALQAQKATRREPPFLLSPPSTRPKPARWSDGEDEEDLVVPAAAAAAAAGQSARTQMAAAAVRPGAGAGKGLMRAEEPLEALEGVEQKALMESIMDRCPCWLPHASAQKPIVNGMCFMQRHATRNVTVYWVVRSGDLTIDKVCLGKETKSKGEFALSNLVVDPNQAALEGMVTLQRVSQLAKPGEAPKWVGEDGAYEQLVAFLAIKPNRSNAHDYVRLAPISQGAGDKMFAKRFHASTPVQKAKAKKTIKQNGNIMDYREQKGTLALQLPKCILTLDPTCGPPAAAAAEVEAGADGEAGAEAEGAKKGGRKRKVPPAPTPAAYEPSRLDLGMEKLFEDWWQTAFLPIARATAKAKAKTKAPFSGRALYSGWLNETIGYFDPQKEAAAMHEEVGKWCQGKLAKFGQGRVGAWCSLRLWAVASPYAKEVSDRLFSASFDAAGAFLV